ncbi:MAG: DNA repair protein RecO [Elioraea sp.]|nr:DNA repair protein RecO [Elioraea sp.]
MEAWEDEAVVLAARPHGEGHAIATVFTRTQGVRRGLVYGGAGRRARANWQPGTLLAARWRARLADQLGRLEGEMVFAASASVLEDPLALAVLASACAVAEAALPEAEPHPRAYEALVGLMGRLADREGGLAAYVRWEVVLLAELGFGLDLTACAVTGAREGLAFVSPRTGRAVSGAAAGPWRERLLPLPAFLIGEAPAAPEDIAAGLRLTGHFLARDVFGSAHRSPPPARERLGAAVAALAAGSPRAEHA